MQAFPPTNVLVLLACPESATLPLLSIRPTARCAAVRKVNTQTPQRRPMCAGAGRCLWTGFSGKPVDRHRME